MPSLGDVLSALLSDAAHARLRADLEAVRIAAVYAQDPLLRNLPIPRFRLPDITVEVPLLVSDISGDSTDSTTGLPFDRPTPTELRQVVRQSLRAAGIRLPRPAVAAVPSDLVQQTTELLESGAPGLLNPAFAADNIARMLVEIVDKALGGDSNPAQLEQLRRAAMDAAAALLAAKQRPSLTWNVAVTAAEIAAHTDRDGIVRLRLTLSEDGYEVIARDDGSGFLLTPE